MSKLYNQPVEVRLSGESLAAFLWRSRWLQVENCERVYIKRNYYDPYNNLPTFRVKASTGGLYDLVQDRGWMGAGEGGIIPTGRCPESVFR